jgi:hypothetical protein
LAHEVQHAIQELEGFARGGSADEFSDRRTDILRRLNFFTNGDLLNGGTVISDSNSLAAALNKNMNMRLPEYADYRIRDAYSDALHRVAKQYGYKDIDALVADFEKIPSALEQYHRLGGEVESRNVQSRMSMSEAERRALLAVETEDVAREDQIMLKGMLGGKAEMGTTVRNRAAQIKEILKDVPMDKNQRAIVDVFTGDSNNAKVKVTRADGTKLVVQFKKGSENRAGTTHSLYKHYGDVSNPYSAQDVLLITKILKNGNRKQDSDTPNRITYTMEVNGKTFIVVTDKAQNRESFVNFYKKGKPSDTSMSYTQESAHTRPEDFDGTKIEQKSETEAIFGEKISSDARLFHLKSPTRFQKYPYFIGDRQPICPRKS